jgi:hypothetical protein
MPVATSVQPEPKSGRPEQEREQQPAEKSSLVIVELDEPQSTTALRRLRQGRGKLYSHVWQIVHDLTEDGTLKAGAQPIVIVVQEEPSPPWPFGRG